MCTQLTIEEQLEQAKQAGFKPDETILVSLDVTVYDEVEHIKDGQTKQFMTDVPQASKDCEDLYECLLKLSLKPENRITFPDKSWKGINKTYKELH